MKRSSYWIAFAMAAAVGGWVASGQFSDPPKQGVDAAPTAVISTSEAAPTRVRVRVSTAQPRLREVVIRGRTAASRKVTLRAQTAGRVAQVMVARGTRVKKGQVVLRLAMDDRKARLDQAKAELDQRQLEFEAATALSKKGYRAATQLALSRANLAAAKAAVARIRLDIAHTTVRAPFNGILDARPTEIGDYVDVGDQVATVVDLDPILFVGELSERDIDKVAVGGKGRAHTVTGEDITGTVRYVATVADAATRTFRIEIEAPNGANAGHRRLVDGVSTEIRLPLAKIPAHLVSPAVLTLSDDGEIGVKAVTTDDLVAFYRVRIIGDGPGGVWLSGLPETVTLITVGQDFVTPGQRVEPVFAPGPGPNQQDQGPDQQDQGKVSGTLLGDGS